MKFADLTRNGRWVVSGRSGRVQIHRNLCSDFRTAKLDTSSRKTFPTLAAPDIKQRVKSEPDRQQHDNGGKEEQD